MTAEVEFQSIEIIGAESMEKCSRLSVVPLSKIQRRRLLAAGSAVGERLAMTKQSSPLEVQIYPLPPTLTIAYLLQLDGPTPLRSTLHARARIQELLPKDFYLCTQQHPSSLFHSARVAAAATLPSTDPVLGHHQSGYPPTCVRLQTTSDRLRAPSTSQGGRKREKKSNDI